ncbi:hypothetical protein F3Y22_tig00111693pilonHSYRG00119 [Hibiscus syriacus]|uniref:Uncharacterized protein n=1 Tax=Hibiscus syriacus TaxID=106335 RepID=A0A6A2YHA0_HIBSY|nr:hypothetical protein F3Y22_tig00111693pilonHSYRG00119 [Hibiscus syriacus]
MLRCSLRALLNHGKFSTSLGPSSGIMLQLCFIGENVVGKEVPEEEAVAASIKFTFNYSLVDVALRILLFVAALSSVVVIVTSKQTEGFRLQRKKMEQLTMALLWLLLLPH